VTVQGRISQADMERAVKAARKVGGARVIVDLAKGKLEIVLQEGADEVATDEWSDDDV
jgi:hypothetical protein